MMPTAFVTSLGVRHGLTRPVSVHSVSSRPVVMRPVSRRARVSMVSPEAVRSVMALYGVCLAGGGVTAFLRTGSKPSVIFGTIGGLLLGAAYVNNSTALALGTAVVMAAAFAYRLYKTRKFLPAGALGLLSVFVIAFFVFSIYA